MLIRCEDKLPHISDNYLYDILKERGILNPEEYLNVDDSCVTDGWLLDNMDKAVDILIAALKDTSKPIVITIDSDVDGFTSAATMWLYLKKLNDSLDLRYLIHEGKQHGIDDFVDQLVEINPQLIIVPDASSSELEVHKHILELLPDTQIIVLDHHLSNVKQDPYCILVNNQLSRSFPNKTLSGVGIVYKFCQCLDQKLGNNYADDFIDLVAVGLVADMMDLRNYETHYIVQTGLNKIQNAGLRYMISSLSYSLGGRTKLEPLDVAFYIAPHFNAVIRVGTQETKETLFLALLDGDRIVPSTKRGARPGDVEIAGEQAARLANNAKALQQRLIDKAMDILESKIFKYDLLENKIILIPIDEEDDIHSSLTGLAAMKIAAKYHKPTMVLRHADGNMLKGSIRAEAGTAMGGFKEYLDSTHMLEYTAGHSEAAGAGILENKVDDFIKLSNERLKNIDFADKAYVVDYLFDANEDFGNIIESISDGKKLWGQNIQEPTLAVKNIKLRKDDIRVMKNNCMKFMHNGVAFVIFKNAQAIEDFTQYDTMLVSVYGRSNMNEWLGTFTPQIIIEDYDIRNDKYRF